MPGTADDGREDSTRSIISGKTGFAHTGAVVNNQSSDFLIHGCLRIKILRKLDYWEKPHTHQQLPARRSQASALEQHTPFIRRCFWWPAGGAQAQSPKLSGLRQRKWPGRLAIALYGNKFDRLVRCDHSPFYTASLCAMLNGHHYPFPQHYYSLFTHSYNKSLVLYSKHQQIREQLCPSLTLQALKINLVCINQRLIPKINNLNLILTHY